MGKQRGRIKEPELKAVASMILQAEDYDKLIQSLNGYRMGLTNKYGKGKRIDTWKQLVKLYK